MTLPLAKKQIVARLRRVGLKQCTCCRDVKTLRDFFRRSLGCAQGPGRPYSECKACHLVRTNAWRKAHPDLVRKIQKKAMAKYMAKLRRQKRKGRR